MLAAMLAACTAVNAQEPPPATPDAARAEDPRPPPDPTVEAAQVNEPSVTPTTDATVPPPDAAIEAANEHTTPPPNEPPKSNPCDDQADLRAWIDTVHSSLYRFSCSTVSWFDGLFGSRPFDDEYRNTHGMVTLGGKWSQRDSFDKTLRFKARVYFPQISSQFNAFVGRADRVEVINESQTDLFELPTQFSTTGDESVFMGLGYNEKMKKRGSFDFDAGVRIAEPLDPYARASYRFTRPIGEHDLIRFREMLFWQEREGFGTTALIEWNHVFDSRNLLRWTTSGTFSENSIGMRWYSDAYLYHLVNTDRAFAYQVLATGSTRSEVPLTDYGFAVIYRQRVWRKWLVLEVRSGIDWPRYFLGEERKANPNGALVFEMRFGRE
jgi:hypothetical protein